MDENKVKIVMELEVMLKSTRAFSDLDHLEYKTNGHSAYVMVYFKNRTYPEPDYRINVTLDSGIALIKDVLRTIA